MVWSQGFCFCRAGYSTAELGKLSAGLGVMRLFPFHGLWNWACTNDRHLVDMSQEISLEYLKCILSAPAPREDLDSVTPFWVGHPLQASEDEFLKIGN